MKIIKYLTLLITGTCIFSQAISQTQTNNPRLTIDVISGYVFPNNFNPTLRTVGNGYNNNNLKAQVISAFDNSDIRIYPSANPQSEVHISIDKTNANNILVSAQTNFSNSIQGYYYSHDDGQSWSGNDHLANAAFGRGDPFTTFDTQGNGYIVTMSPNANMPSPPGPDGYYVIKTTDKGVTWQTEIRGYGPITSGDFDKEMAAVDNMPNSPYANNFYCAWSEGFVTGNWTVKFNRSTDGLNSFSTPISLKTSKWGQGTNVQTGPNGEVYVCWADYTNGISPAQNIGFSKSTDGGATFSTSLAFAYSGIRRSDFAADPLFNYTRVNDFPAMAVDKSCGLNRGRIYIAYPAKENGTGKAVIQVRYSDDQGSTWSLATTISISNGRQNWFPWIAVDDATGLVSVVYYSLDAPSGFSTNTYMAYSIDGGITFDNIKVSDVPHITSPISGFIGGYAGDYIGVTAYGGKAYAAWSDNRNGTWQIYVSLVTFNAPILYSSDNNIDVNGSININTGQIANYQAVNNITATANNTNFQISSGVTVSMVAGNQIILKPGFTASIGSDFHAYIGNATLCTNAYNRIGNTTTNTPKTSLNAQNNKDVTNNNFTIYPNPNSGTFTISGTDMQQIHILSTAGKLVREMRGPFANAVQVSGLCAGLYIVRVQMTDGRLENRKVVVAQL